MSDFTPMRVFDSAERASREEREEARAQCLSKFRSVFIAALFLGLFAVFVIFMRVPTPDESYDPGSGDEGSATDSTIAPGSVFLVQLDGSAHLAIWSQTNNIDGSLSIQYVVFENSTVAPSTDQIHPLYTTKYMFTLLDYVYLPDTTPPSLHLVGPRVGLEGLVVLSYNVTVNGSSYRFNLDSEHTGVLPFVSEAFILPVDRKSAYLISTADSCNGTSNVQYTSIPVNSENKKHSLNVVQELEHSNNELQFAGLIHDSVTNTVRPGLYVGKYVTDTQCPFDAARFPNAASDLSARQSFAVPPECNKRYHGYRFQIGFFPSDTYSPPWNDTYTIHYTWGTKTLVRSPECLCQWWNGDSKKYEPVTQPWALQLCVSGRLQFEKPILKVLKQNPASEPDPFSIVTITLNEKVSSDFRVAVTSEDSAIHVYASEAQIIFSGSDGHNQTYVAK